MFWSGKKRCKTLLWFAHIRVNKINRFKVNENHNKNQLVQTKFTNIHNDDGCDSGDNKNDDINGIKKEERTDNGWLSSSSFYQLTIMQKDNIYKNGTKVQLRKTIIGPVEWMFAI